MTTHRTAASAIDLLEQGFLEQRARLLEVAAFLDRLDRAQGGEEVQNDYRHRALCRMLQVLGNRSGGRAAEMLVLLSDPTQAVVADRIPSGKASGAWEGGR